MIKLKRITIILLFLSFIFSISHANENLEIKQMQQQLKQQFLKQQQQIEFQPEKLEFIPEAKKNNSTKCLAIKKIEINGSSIFKMSKLQQIAHQSISKCTTLDDIQNIIDNLNILYFKHGYVTSRANIPMPQTKLAEEILVISISEGKIANIILNENNHISSKKAKLFNSVVRRKNSFLNIRDLEQTIDNFANINNSDSNFTILPGKDVGTSDIVIKNKIQNPHYIRASLDNSGTSQTSKNKYHLHANFGDLFNLNENINISFSSLYRRKSHKRQNIFSSLNYSIPFRKYLFNYSLSRSNYVLGTNLTQATYYSLGNSTINKFTLNRNIFRDSKIKINLEAALTLKNIKSYNKIFHVKLINEAGTKKLSIANIGLNNVIYSKYGNVTLKTSYKFGLDNFAALNDKDTLYQEEAQYEAFNLYLNYAKIFSKYPIKYDVVIDSQKSKDILFASEAFYAGGEYSVRGFKEHYIQGDSGVLVRNDLTINKNLASYLNLNNHVLNTSFFFDYGTTKANIEEKNHHVSGAGLKLSLKNNLAFINITYSKALKTPAHITENEVIYADISKILFF